MEYQINRLLFPPHSYVMMMPFKRQALVEFDSLESAKRCVTCGGSEPIFIANQQAFFNFSTSQRITRPTNADDPSSRNKVLLLSIQNPLYPISTVSGVVYISRLLLLRLGILCWFGPLQWTKFNLDHVLIIHLSSKENFDLRTLAKLLVCVCFVVEDIKLL